MKKKGLVRKGMAIWATALVAMLWCVACDQAECILEGGSPEECGLEVETPEPPTPPPSPPSEDCAAVLDQADAGWKPELHSTCGIASVIGVSGFFFGETYYLCEDGYVVQVTNYGAQNGLCFPAGSYRWRFRARGAGPGPVLSAYAVEWGSWDLLSEWRKIYVSDTWNEYEVLLSFDALKCGVKIQYDMGYSSPWSQVFIDSTEIVPLECGDAAPPEVGSDEPPVNEIPLPVK